MIPELNNPSERTNFYLHLKAYRRNGFRDYELLYWGARFALSLGLIDEARQWLTALQEIWSESDNSTNNSYFPVGLLSLLASPSEEDRAVIKQKLERIPGISFSLFEKINDNLYLSSANSTASGSHTIDPSDRFEQINKKVLHQLKAAVPLINEAVNEVDKNTSQNTRHLLATSFKNKSALEKLKNLSQKSNLAYAENDIHNARLALEEMLLIDGDQPDVLRNLITITSEQNLISDYERYWRRYVKLLLWKMLFTEEVERARLDLILFYFRAATLMEREIGKTDEANSKLLGRHGFLQRWVEVFAGLIWIQSMHLKKPAFHPDGNRDNYVEYYSLAKVWMKIFYPEFSPHFKFSHSPNDNKTFNKYLPSQISEIVLTFNPVQKFLIRFLEWYRLNFGIHQASAGNFHKEAVVAYGICVSNLPLKQHIHNLSMAYPNEDLGGISIREKIVQACSIGIKNKINDCINKDKQDWQSLVELLESPYRFQNLDVDDQLLYALSLINTGSSDASFDVACSILPMMSEEMLKEGSQAYNIWMQLFEATLAGIIAKGKNSDTNVVVCEDLESLKSKIKDIEAPARSLKFRKRLLQEIDKVFSHIKLQEKVDDVIAKVGIHLNKKDYIKARQTINSLPDQPDEIRKLKRNLLSQVKDVEKQNLKIDNVIAQVGTHLRRKDYRKARQTINGLPDQPDEIRKLKANLLSQVDEVEEQNLKIEDVIAQVGIHLNKKDYMKARQTINGLPDQPDDIRKLKANLLSQVDEVEERDKIQMKIEDVIAQVKMHLSRKDYRKARQTINGLPDQPEDIRKLKRNLLSQIDDVEEQNNIQAEVDDVISQVKNHLSRKDYRKARQTINSLPDQPDDIRKLKVNLLSQVDAVEEQNDLQTLLDSTILKVKDHLSRADFYNARQAVNALPNYPDEIEKIKDNLLSQIEALENQFYR